MTPHLPVLLRLIYLVLYCYIKLGTIMHFHRYMQIYSTWLVKDVVLTTTILIFLHLLAEGFQHHNFHLQVHCWKHFDTSLTDTLNYECVSSVTAMLFICFDISSSLLKVGITNGWSVTSFIHKCIKGPPSKLSPNLILWRRLKFAKSEVYIADV